MSYSVKKYVGSNQGFTLVELLIVVAIIGVLASQGVPAYRRMIQKSRKGEAQVMLGNIATAESGFFSEYGQYTNNIARAGAQAEGSNFNYAAGFSGANCAQVTAIVPVTGTAVGQVPNLPGNWNVGLNGPTGVATTSMLGKVNGYVATNPRNTCVTTALSGFNAVAVVTGAAPTYVAGATGNLKDPNDPSCVNAAGPTNTCDAWYIDQNRRMINVRDGVSN